MSKELNVLRVDSSGRYEGSSTRALTDSLINALGSTRVVTRDLAKGVPHVNEAWIQANFTDADRRTDAQEETLTPSDRLVAEIKHADVLIIGIPVYNFGIPAALKAWLDMVARARLTFRYTESGPQGLLAGKKAYLVVASGGVAVDSDVDFATPYMRHVLKFLGITDVEVVSADQQTSRGEEAVNVAHTQIAGIVLKTHSFADAANGF